MIMTALFVFKTFDFVVIFGFYWRCECWHTCDLLFPFFIFRSSENDGKLERNVEYIAEVLARHVFNLTTKVSSKWANCDHKKVGIVYRTRFTCIHVLLHVHLAAMVNINFCCMEGLGVILYSFFLGWLGVG